MTRVFTAESLVTLPRLDGYEAARLLKELIAAAKAEGRAGWLGAELAELEPAYAAMAEALTKRLTGEGIPLPQVREADLAEDNAFIALHEWLHGWSRLPDARHPQAARAAAALAAVFPHGRSFLALRPSDEWQEAELRVRLIADKGHDATIEALGGGPLLEELRRAHAAYGEALGITAVKAAPEPAQVGEAREAAIDALRGYVLRITAQIRRSKPDTQALADRLLAPLVAWRDRPTQRQETIEEPAAEPEV